MTDVVYASRKKAEDLARQLYQGKEKALQGNLDEIASDLFIIGTILPHVEFDASDSKGFLYDPVAYNMVEKAEDYGIPIIQNKKGEAVELVREFAPERAESFCQYIK